MVHGSEALLPAAVPAEAGCPWGCRDTVHQLKGYLPADARAGWLLDAARKWGWSLIAALGRGDVSPGLRFGS